MEKQEINKIIGNKLAEVRKKKGFTQNELADKIGFSRGHLSCVEIGDSEIGTIFLYKVCIALKCQITDILPSKETVVSKSILG